MNEQVKEGGSVTMRDVKQSLILNWAVDTFGECANNQTERLSRFVEESVELAQSLDMTEEDVVKLVRYVFSRPKGTPYQEVGGVSITLLALCEKMGISQVRAEDTEWARINAIEPLVFRKKQDSKFEAGVGLESN